MAAAAAQMGNGKLKHFFTDTHNCSPPSLARFDAKLRQHVVRSWRKKEKFTKFENFPISTQFPAHTSCERQQWQSNVSEEIKIMMEILERFRSDKTQERETTSYGESSVSAVGV